MLFDNLKNYKNLHTTLDKVNWFTAGSAGRKPKATSLPHSRYPISYGFSSVPSPPKIDVFDIRYTEGRTGL